MPQIGKRATVSFSDLEEVAIGREDGDGSVVASGHTEGRFVEVLKVKWKRDRTRLELFLFGELNYGE